MSVLARSPGDVLSSMHFDPGHFTASGFVTDPTNSRMLVIHHRRLDMWLQPGGHVEPTDPTLLAAAVREVLEETGVAVPPPATRARTRGCSTSTSTGSPPPQRVPGTSTTTSASGSSPRSRRSPPVPRCWTPGG